MGLAPSLHLSAILLHVGSILELDALRLSSIGSGGLHGLGIDGSRGRRKLGHRAELAVRPNWFRGVHLMCFLAWFFAHGFYGREIFENRLKMKINILDENRLKSSI